jgi:cytochrome c-type biogenesis protein
MEVLAIDQEAAEALVLAGYSTMDELNAADLLDLAMIRPVGTTGAQWIKAKLKKLDTEPIASAPKATPVPPTPPPETAAEPSAAEPVPEAAPPAPAPEPVEAPPETVHVEPVQPAGSPPPPPYVSQGQPPGSPPPPPHVVQEQPVREVRPTETPPQPVPTTASPPVKEEPAPTPPVGPTPAAPVAGAVSGPSIIEKLLDHKRNLIAVGAVGVVIMLIAMFVIAPMFALERAPDFTMKTTDGDTIRLSDYRGDKIVIVDFMYADCTGCKKGINHLKEVYDKYDGEIEILSISYKSGETEREKLEQLKEDKGATWPFGQVDEKLLVDYNVDTFPTYFIIDKEGYVTFKSSHADAGQLSDEIDAVQEGRATRQAVVSLGVYGLAFVAGMVTFFSPCAYPLMPAYMSYYVTMDAKDEEEDVKKAMRRGAIQGTIPAMAMLLFFGLIGLAVGIFGYFIFGFLGYIGLAMGIMILIFGFAMLRDINIPFHYVTTPIKDIALKLYHFIKDITGGIVSKETAEKAASRVTGRDVKLDSEEQGVFGLFTYGLVYAAASSACVAPLFFLVITIGIAQGGIFGGFMVLLLYGLGMGVLMVTFTALIAGSRTKLIDFMKVHMKTIERISGTVMMIAGAMLIYFWYLAEFS